MSGSQRPRTGRGWWVTGVVLVALGVATAAGAFWFSRSSYTVITEVGGSMEPTYPQGRRVVIERSGGEEAERGDAVLYKVPDRYEGMPVLQRVIGLGGDHLVYSGGTLTVNGRRVDEPYAKREDGGHGVPAYDVKAAPGRMFLMGDNRGNAHDSRYFPDDHSGTVPVSAVQGRALGNSAVPVVLGLTAVLGILLAVGGGICVLAGLLIRRAGRARALSGPSPVPGVDGQQALRSAPER